MDARSPAPLLPVVLTPELARLLESIRRDAARRTAEALACRVPRGGPSRPAPPEEQQDRAA